MDSPACKDGFLSGAHKMFVGGEFQIAKVPMVLRKLLKFRVMMSKTKNVKDGKPVCSVKASHCIGPETPECFCEPNTFHALTYNLTYIHDLGSNPNEKIMWLSMAVHSKKSWDNPPRPLPNVYELDWIKTSLQVNGLPVSLQDSTCEINVTRDHNTVQFCCQGPPLPCGTNVTALDMSSRQVVDSVQGLNCSTIVHTWTLPIKYVFSYSACDVRAPRSYRCLAGTGYPPVSTLVTEIPKSEEFPRNLADNEPMLELKLNGQSLELQPGFLYGSHCQVRLRECANMLTFCCSHTHYTCQVKVVSNSDWNSDLGCVTLKLLATETGQLELSYLWLNMSTSRALYCDLIPATISRSLALTYDNKRVELRSGRCLIKVVSSNKELKFCCFHNTSICRARISFQGDQLSHSPCAAINVGLGTDTVVVFSDSFCNSSAPEHQYVCRVLYDPEKSGSPLSMLRVSAIVLAMFLLVVPIALCRYQLELDNNRRKTPRAISLH